MTGWPRSGMSGRLSSQALGSRSVIGQADCVIEQPNKTSPVAVSAGCLLALAILVILLLIAGYALCAAGTCG